jgi:hypothetical protein
MQKQFTEQVSVYGVSFMARDLTSPKLSQFSGHQKGLATGISRDRHVAETE